ncbi:DoxX family membrane protein OS=Streptomyces tendae OX=1932 GN=GUR47_26140 PE=4 SV=1 [Streptomyces tendae]
MGVLTVLGCWQRVAAVIGAAPVRRAPWSPSAGSASPSPAYDAPDIIYLAAWSPLIIAGAPVYSVDGRLAGSAWRRLGPRSDIWDLRRYVLRRGAVITFLVAGVTLLVGSVLGGAVRDADRVVVPGPGEAPRNELPGSPLPQDPGTREPKTSSPEASASPTQGATSGASAPAQDGATTPGATRDSSGTATGGGTPSQTQGTTGGQAPPRQSAPGGGQAPSTTAGPTSGGGTSTGGTGGSTGSTGSGDGGGSSSTGEPGSRLVGGLLG